jgi:hypothetical protein
MKALEYQRVATLVARLVMDETHHALGLALKQRPSPALADMHFALGLALKQRPASCVGSSKQQASVQGFLADRCEVGDEAVVTPENVLWKSYNEWRDKRGEQQMHISKAQFVNIIIDLNPSVRRRTTSVGGRAGGKRPVRTRSLVGICAGSQDPACSGTIQ